MGLLSFFKRADGTSPNASPSDPGDAVQHARTRARQRLTGAVVLVIVGVIGFPLVFETQPRPIPVDIPIEVPRREGAPALVMPPERTAPLTSTASPEPNAPVAETPSDVITESREEAGREVTSSIADPAASPGNTSSKPARETPTQIKAATATAPAAAPKSDARPEPKAPAAEADAARARALLEGKPSTGATEGTRFIVQVGAFADAAAAHNTRLKVEKLGMKTYTQVASTAAGGRIRVRVGPFVNRADAEKAMARAKGAGLSAVVLTL